MRREFALRRCGRMKKMTYTELCREVRGANLVLVGIGEDLEGDLDGFYRSLSELLQKKDYFIVTLKDRDSLEKAGLFSEQITAPLQKGEDAVSWDRYLNWLGFTLNQNLCILELGVGFLRPEVIRFPFEKTCYFNQKSRYIRVHDRFWQLSAEIADRGVSVGQPPAVFFTEGREEAAQ
ncbi:hypothetical protein B5F29_14880 [Lachnoclostridium sp. An196]|nr:hypothetical protein B5F29_14880 [Lachnoclostridium sp. An196]